ncbi:hypothetical protein [Ramlibacter sp. AN1133]|uniref:hypothetical protein n=1 Tax=Ramlibacter sp. AN1133 TaxID=3133429 RepID=UPI0030C19BCD
MAEKSVDQMVEDLRAVNARHRQVLQALCDGSQLVLRFRKWEAYGELEGKVRPLGLALEHGDLQTLVEMLPEGAIVVRPGRPATDGYFEDARPTFAYAPAQHRTGLRELLTLSMPTQHLAECCDQPGDSTTAGRRERMGA